MTTSQNLTPNIINGLQRASIMATIILLCTACGSNSAATPTAAPVAASTATSTAVTEGPTTTPVPEPTVEPTKSVPGVNLTLDPALGKSVSTQIMPAVPKTEGPAFGDAAPQHVLVSFDGEAPNPDDARQRHINIYPVEGLRSIDPSISKIIDQLKQTLQRKPKTIRGAAPFLPAYNASQLFYSNLEYVKFANGEGLRFVTAYAQDVEPITNEGIFYTFQGLTSDGKYLISAVYPVAAEGLPKKFDDTPAATDYEAFAKGYEKYLDVTTAQLNKLTPQQFTPDLSKLDNMMASLQAEPQIEGELTVADPNQGAGADAKATPTVGADTAKVTPTAEAAADAGATQGAVAVVRRLVNLRESPSLRGKVLSNLSRGSRVELLGRNARLSWLRVKTEDGTEGWVSRSFLSTRYNLRSLPVAP